MGLKVGGGKQTQFCTPPPLKRNADYVIVNRQNVIHNGNAVVKAFYFLGVK